MFNVVNNRMATGQGRSGKFYFSSGSGRSLGILQNAQRNFKYQESQGKVWEFPNFGPTLFGHGRHFIYFE